MLGYIEYWVSVLRGKGWYMPYRSPLFGKQLLEEKAEEARLSNCEPLLAVLGAESLDLEPGP